MGIFQKHFFKFHKDCLLVPEKYVLFDEKGLQFSARNGIISQKTQHLCGLPPLILRKREKVNNMDKKTMLTTMSIELSLPKRLLSVISNVKAVAPPRCVPT